MPSSSTMRVFAQSADLQQPVPVAVVSGESRYLQPQYHPGATHADFGHQLLEALTVCCRRAGLTLVAVDDNDVFETPPQGDRTLFEGILSLGALGVLEDLLHRGLSYVEIGLALEVQRK